MCTGWARIAYRARKNTNATGTRPCRPSRVPHQISAPSKKPTIVCWDTAHLTSARRGRTSGSWRPNRGPADPLRQAATKGIPTNAATPKVPPMAKDQGLPGREVDRRIGAGREPKHHHRNDGHHGYPIGAIAVTVR